VEGVPGGICAICGDRLGTYGHQEWHASPLAVLRADLAIRDDASSVALNKELIALADLVAAHPNTPPTRRWFHACGSGPGASRYVGRRLSGGSVAAGWRRALSPIRGRRSEPGEYQVQTA
jgi:hypothetical protein